MAKRKLGMQKPPVPPKPLAVYLYLVLGEKGSTHTHPLTIEDSLDAAINAAVHFAAVSRIEDVKICKMRQGERVIFGQHHFNQKDPIVVGDLAFKYYELGKAS